MNDLFYNRPAEAWLDGLPLGNGRLGAMVLPTGESLRLQLNDSTAWSGSPASEHRHGQVSAESAAQALADARAAISGGRPVDAERSLEKLQSRYSQAYLPFADLVITTPAGAVLQERGLSLAEATHRTTAAFSSGSITQETFISAVDGVLAHRILSTKPIDVAVELSTPLKETARNISEGGVVLELRLPADVAPGHEADEPPLRWEADGITPLEGAVFLASRHDGVVNSGAMVGGRRATVFTGVTELLLVIATESTFTGIGEHPEGSSSHRADAAGERARAAVSKDWDALHQDSTTAHRALFDRVSVTFEPGPDALPSRNDTPTDVRVREADAHPAGVLTADPALVALLYNYGRYLLIASSLPGTLPATLQGIWNEELRPPWSSNFTLNINAQMNYWGAEAAALPECQEPFLDLVEALAARGRNTAATLYGARGWVAHHNTDAWAFTSPTSGHASWSQWPMAGAWLIRHLDERRRFGSAGSDELDRFWTLAVGAAEFAVDWLIDDGGAHLETRPSTSPENCYLSAQGRAAVATSTAMDRALITELFEVVESLAPLVGAEDHRILDEVRAALPRIAPPAVGADGRILEWGSTEKEAEPTHRHLSHLFFAYPGNGPNSQEAEAVSRSLDTRGDDSTGWSLVWKICLRARLRQKEKVADLLQLMFRPATGTAVEHAGGLYANLFAAHPPFQIDGNLGFVGALSEVLLQSHSDVVRLLPAVPDGLRSGKASGLIARPGIAVDLLWQEGDLLEAVLTPLTESAAAERLVAIGGHTERVLLTLGNSTTLSRRPGADTFDIRTNQQENT